MSCEKNPEVEALRLSAEAGMAQFKDAGKKLVDMGYAVYPQPDNTVYVVKNHVEDYGTKYVPPAPSANKQSVANGAANAANS